jgi:hypothetical protein
MRQKNRLDKLWNIPPQNPTQTRYLRFLRSPEGRLKTMWSEGMERFNQKMVKGIQTAYSELLEGYDDRYG